MQLTPIRREILRVYHVRRAKKTIGSPRVARSLAKGETLLPRRLSLFLSLIRDADLCGGFVAGVSPETRMQTRVRAYARSWFIETCRHAGMPAAPKALENFLSDRCFLSWNAISFALFKSPSHALSLVHGGCCIYHCCIYLKINIAKSVYSKTSKDAWTINREEKWIIMMEQGIFILF